MRISAAFLLVVVVAFTCRAQCVDSYGGSLGIRVNTFNVHAREGVTRAGEGISITYYAGLNLGKVMVTEKLVFYSGIDFSKELINYHPALMLQEIQHFRPISNDSLTVSQFRMWNNQVGIPLKVSLRLYDGFTKFGPFFMIPAIYVHAGVLNNFMVRKSYNDVVMVQNYGKTNAYIFYDDALNSQVSTYYVKTISNYNLIGQAGLGFLLPKAYANRHDLDYGFNFSLNRYLVSPFLQEIKIANRTSVDLQFFITVPIKQL